SRMGAASGPLRACSRQNDDKRRSCPRFRQARALEARTAAPETRWLRPAETMRRFFAAAVIAATAIAFAFLLLPVVAIFLRVPVGHLFAQLGDRVTRDALFVSLKTSAIAHACVVVVGTPTAYILGRNRFRGQAAVLTLVEL